VLTEVGGRMTSLRAQGASWWPTPVLEIDHTAVDELNAGLTRIILEKEKDIPAKGMPTPVAGLDKGLTTHWLEYNVLGWDYPECHELRSMVLEGIREYIGLVGEDPDDPEMRITGISCWANVLRHGESLKIHHHDPAFVTAHYTVQSGREEADDPADAGSTVYYRPGFIERSHGGAQAGQTSPWDAEWTVSHPPLDGRLLFFPSYVRHEVRPHLGARERITIALDAYIEKQHAMVYFGGPRWFVPDEK